jgi:hypothetical protein
MAVEITITIGMRIRILVGITIRIIGGRITTGIICIRKMGITMRITIRITILKRKMSSGLTVVGKQGRQTHGRTHTMFFAHTTG